MITSIPPRASYDQLLAAIAAIPHPKLTTIARCEEHVLAIDDVCRANGWTFREYSQKFFAKSMNEYAFLYAYDEIKE